MRAIVQKDVGRLVCREVPEPEPKRDEVKIKVACCGVCGSDIHSYQGIIPMEIHPFIPGHEFTGTVVAVGSEVRNFKVGDRVTAQPFRTADSLCIVGVHCDGAMAEYVCMEEKYTFHLPDCISFEDGTLIEPACVSGHAVLDYADLRPADDVAVIGHDNWSVLTSSSRPALTSIDNETETIGRRAARYLVDAIDGNPHHGVDYVPCHLIQRESTLPLD